MYYRRKVFLAVLEAFNGSLEKTDFQKILFLFCKYTGNNHYDFFPYKYGGFSMISYLDKKTLTQQGLLCQQDNFELSEYKGQDYIKQLCPQDQLGIKLLKNEIRNLRGNELIRKVYLEFPLYTARSQIAKKLLNLDEYAQIQRCWNQSTETCLFTIGYEGLSIDAYIKSLVVNNIKALIDVRKNPLSKKYGFSKTKLANYINTAGINYYHLPQLGVPSHLRQNLNDDEAYKKLFDFYKADILKNQEPAINELKEIITKEKRVALTCFEDNPRFCHRYVLAQHIENAPDINIPLIHITDKL